MKALIAGGGTAGHVFPAVALAQELTARGIEITFVGTTRGLETRLVPAQGFPLVTLDVIGFPRRISRDAARAPIALARARRACGPLVAEHDIVVGMGGYASAPAVLAARRQHRPVVLHEQNAVPGLANRVLSRRADLVALSFVESAGAFPRGVRTAVTGNPVRRQVADADLAGLRAEAYAAFGFDPSCRTAVVFGGSQGARHIDEATVELVARWEGREDVQVLLLSGAAHEADVRARIPADSRPTICIQGFLDRMELAYAVADLVVARAGATTIAELGACGLPALLIPYPHATDDHQTANAEALVKAGAARMLRDAELTAETLGVHVDGLLTDEGTLHAMGAAALGRGAAGAAGALADLVEEYAA